MITFEVIKLIGFCLFIILIHYKFFEAYAGQRECPRRSTRKEAEA